jgi:hypothetical protein
MIKGSIAPRVNLPQASHARFHTQTALNEAATTRSDTDLLKAALDIELASGRYEMMNGWKGSTR